MTHFLKILSNKQSKLVYKDGQSHFIHREKMKVFDIYGINRNDFDLPYYEFNHGDRVAIKKLIIDWKFAPHKVFGIISTNLISGFSENPRHQLCCFVKVPKTTITEVEFTTPIYHEVQRPFLQNAKFNIESMFSNGET